MATNLIVKVLRGDGGALSLNSPTGSHFPLLPLSKPPSRKSPSLGLAFILPLLPLLLFPAFPISSNNVSHCYIPACLFQQPPFSLLILSPSFPSSLLPSFIPPLQLLLKGKGSITVCGYPVFAAHFPPAVFCSLGKNPIRNNHLK